MPTHSTSTNNTAQAASMVTPGLKAAVQARAVAEGIKPSDIIRRALMAYLGVDALGRPVGGAE